MKIFLFISTIVVPFVIAPLMTLSAVVTTVAVGQLLSFSLYLSRLSSNESLKVPDLHCVWFEVNLMSMVEHRTYCLEPLTEKIWEGAGFQHTRCFRWHWVQKTQRVPFRTWKYLSPVEHWWSKPVQVIQHIIVAINGLPPHIRFLKHNLLLLAVLSRLECCC